MCEYLKNPCFVLVSFRPEIVPQNRVKHLLKLRKLKLVSNWSKDNN